MSLRSLAPLGAFMLALGMGALAVHAGAHRAAERRAPADPCSMAVVDMDYLYTASGARDMVEQKSLFEIRAAAQQRLNAIEATPFLAPNERLEYLDLLSKDTPEPAQQERIKAIRATSDQRGAELQTLQTKKDADLTPADKTRLNELFAEQRASEETLPGIQEVMHLRIDQKTDALRREQIQHLRAAVAQVAKEKGFTKVFDTNALVYSTDDLTSQVLQRLGKHPGK